ncbi:hypothetical protein BKA70DRAFT_1423651 [Coprinopsis sp. MPI-PUGE-AT-0042]|nr:hypothetical protein BKA70DRAFT_1423651 [Coprinopsis sp. MPI-PUGE-AT-0042]
MIVTHANLKTLHLHKVNFRAQHPLSNLLEELPALEKLYITLCNFYRDPHKNRRNVPTHHSLRHLVIGYSNSMPTRVFSGSLPLCPRLERITFVPSLSCNISPLEDQEEVPYLEFVSEPHAHLTIDLSHLTDSAAAAAALPMASSMSQLNVLTPFDITMVSIIKLSLTWIEACPLRTIISRTSPIGWSNSHWMDWAEALAPARKQLPDVKFYLPKMPSDISETTATSLRNSGINLVFLSQNEIQRRLGDPDIEEYLETRQSWDPNNIAF